MRLPLLLCVQTACLQRLLQHFTDAGFEVLWLDGSRIEDKRSFFAGVREQLPLDPPLRSEDRWDALFDSLWGGLGELEKPRVALVWTHCHRMLRRGLPDLLTAVDGLLALARDAARAGDGPAEVRIVLVGEGDNFRELADYHL